MGQIGILVSPALPKTSYTHSAAEASARARTEEEEDGGSENCKRRFPSRVRQVLRRSPQTLWPGLLSLSLSLFINYFLTCTSLFFLFCEPTNLHF